MIKRLTILDSLRGLAALIVVIHHFSLMNGVTIKKFLNEWAWKALVFISDLNLAAVLFFFVLSGFCIALAQKGQLLTSAKAINHYLYKRFKRILPIYWIALALSAMVGILMQAIHQETYGLINLLGNLFFLQTSSTATMYWFSPYGNNGPLWSLAYEMFFYLLFPIYCLVRRKNSLFSTYSLQLAILAVISLLAILINKTLFYIPLLAFLSSFIIWIAGYLIGEIYLSNQKRDRLFIVVFLLATLSLIFKEKVPSTAIYVIGKGLFISCLFYCGMRLRKLGQISVFKMALLAFNKMFCYVGHGSYAVYAFHYPILMAMNYYQIHIAIQLFAVLLFILICPQIETKLANPSFSFLKKNYLPTNR